MAANLKTDHGGYEPKTCMPKERVWLKKGMEIWRQALAQDERERRQRGSGLPKDWRGRIIN